IGLRCQGPKALLVLPLLQVEDDTAFIHVGVDKGQAEVLLTSGEKRRQVTARIPTRRLDFDHIGAKVAQNAADKGPERCCHIQDAHACQRSRGTLMVGCCHRCSSSSGKSVQRWLSYQRFPTPFLHPLSGRTWKISFSVRGLTVDAGTIITAI